jgi:aldose 1-epimerase
VIDDDAPVLEVPWPGTDPGDGAAPPVGAAQHPGSGRPLRLALQATDPGSGRRLDVWSDRPGIQLYTANAFDGSIVGKSGRVYRQGDGFTAETQGFPDAPNQPGFPSTVIGPQQVFRSTTVFAFRIA